MVEWGLVWFWGGRWEEGEGEGGKGRVVGVIVVEGVGLGVNGWGGRGRVVGMVVAWAKGIELSWWVLLRPVKVEASATSGCCIRC